MTTKNPISVRAVIVKDGQVLTLRRDYPDSPTIWTFPGGHFEDFDKDGKEALARECLEEENVKIEVGELIFEQNFKGTDNHFYLAKILGGEVGLGSGPEYNYPEEYHGSHHPQWLKIKDLAKFDLRPVELRDKIIDLSKDKNE